MSAPQPVTPLSPTPPGLARTIACTACHRSKVRCVQDRPGAPCLRCRKTGKECTIDPRQLKKRRKAGPLEDQVRELNLEVARQRQLIDHLRGRHDNRGALHQHQHSQSQSLPASPLGPIFKDPPHSRTDIASLVNAVDSPQPPTAADLSSDRTKRDLVAELRALNSFNLQRFYCVSSNFSSIGAKRQRLVQKNYLQETNVIGQGLLTYDQVQQRLNLYITRLYTRLSVVAVPKKFIKENSHPVSSSSSTSGKDGKPYPTQGSSSHQYTIDIDGFRAQSPILYLAILAIASVALPSTEQRTDPLDVDLRLNIQAMRLVSHEILIVGSKTIELLQSLLLMCIWYDSAELFQHRRYQLINTLCVSLAEDLGLNGKIIYYFSKVESIVKRAPLSDISQSIESRILALSVYSINISYCMFLKRTITVRWSSYYEECCSILTAHPDSNFRKVAVFAKLNSLLEKIFKTLHATERDPFDINDPRTRYIITDLHHSCTNVKKLIPSTNYALLSYYYSIEAYLFEPSLHRVLVSDNNQSQKEDGKTTTKSANNDSVAETTSELDTTQSAGKSQSQDDIPDYKGHDYVKNYNFDITDSNIFSTYMISTIGRCSDSCIRGIEYYCKLSPADISTLPLIVQSRIFYMCGILLRLRYLTLLVPKYSEVNLLPERLLSVLNNALETNYTVSLQFPYNYFLPKSRMVLMLFLQTFTGRIKSVLESRFGINANNVETYAYHQQQEGQQQQQQPFPRQQDLPQQRQAAQSSLETHNPDYALTSRSSAYHDLWLSRPYQSSLPSGARDVVPNRQSPLLPQYSHLSATRFPHPELFPPLSDHPLARNLYSNFTGNSQTPMATVQSAQQQLQQLQPPTLDPRDIRDLFSDSTNFTNQDNLSAIISSNGVSLEDFLFDNSGTANNVGITVPSTASGAISAAPPMSNAPSLAPSNTASNVNNESSQPTSHTSPIDPTAPGFLGIRGPEHYSAGARQNGEFSYFALNDNIWNELLMGMGFDGGDNSTWQ